MHLTRHFLLAAFRAHNPFVVVVIGSHEPVGLTRERDAQVAHGIGSALAEMSQRHLVPIRLITGGSSGYPEMLIRSFCTRADELELSHTHASVLLIVPNHGPMIGDIPSLFSIEKRGDTTVSGSVWLRCCFFGVVVLVAVAVVVVVLFFVVDQLVFPLG